ncbi:MAG: ATP-binding protein [Candidatus Aquicultorales bacterium]
MRAFPGIRLEIPSEGSQLSRVRSAAGKFAAELGFDEAQVYHIKVAVSEAVANAIEHGSPKGTANKVIVQFEDDGDKLVAQVTDEGQFRSKMPTFQPGAGYRGRGLFLMSALMDEVDIKETEQGTTLRLIKKKDSHIPADWVAAQ